jgi:hypothetical protein
MVSFATASLVCLALLQDVSTTGKFPITDPFFYRSYVNIHLDKYTWEEPTEPAFLPQVHAPILPSLPLQDAPAAQPAPADIQSVDLTAYGRYIFIRWELGIWSTTSTVQQ